MWKTVAQGLSLLVLIAAGCSLFPTGPTDCRKHPCPDGQVCDPGGTCRTVTPPDLAYQPDLSSAPDLGPSPDLSAPPDLTLPPDLGPECVKDNDCGAGSGIGCKAGKCAPCAVHSDCTSNLCDVYQQNSKNDFGRCLPEASVLYVDNKNGGACTSGDGSQGGPLCTIAEAVAAIGGAKTAVRVLPSTGSYKPLSLDLGGKTAALYGPADNGGTAQIGGDANAQSVNITNLTGSSTVLMDGFTITGGAVGIRCTGLMSSLKLHRSKVTGNTNGGVLGVQCKLEVDRCQISSNGNTTQSGSKSGLFIRDVSGYVVTNNFIVKNQAPDIAAVQIQGASTGVFRFNTVVDNQNAALNGSGIDCTGNGVKLEDSIIFRNTPDIVKNTQVVNGCMLTGVVVGIGDNATGGLHDKNPVFLNPTNLDYRLDTGADNSCCIDKAIGMIDFDYFGTKRPLGAGYDIGAHEAK